MPLPLPASLPAIASQRRRFACAIDNPDTLFPIPAFKMWWVVLLLAAPAPARAQNTCLANNHTPYSLFGTKTAYNFVHKNLPNLNPQIVPGCAPAAIWLLNRHGATNPEADELPELQSLVSIKDSVVQNYRDGYDKEPRMCLGDRTLLERWAWSPRQNLTHAGQVTSAGYGQTHELGMSWRNRYPALFTDNKHDYMFKFAKDRRSSDTFQAFTDGLFKPLAEEADLPQEHDEKLVKPDKNCPAWSRDVGDNKETLQQRDIFESKKEWRDMVTNVSSRLGFTRDLDLSLIKRIYQMCRYNKAWDVAQISPWCSAFSREDLRRFEYSEDLETYYKYGYGTPSNVQLACPLVKDMLEFLERHANANAPQQPLATVLLVEAPALLLLAAAAGARRDAAPLTGDNYHLPSAQARRWTSSDAAPYNGNLAAVLYKCNPNGNFGYKDRHQVLFLQNEQPMDLEFCKVGLCEWPELKNRLADITSKCNADFCNGASASTSFAAVTVGFLALFVRYLV